MKPVYNNNKERAKVLHRLFPQEIEKYIRFLQIEAERIIKDPSIIKKKFPDEFITTPFWEELAKISGEFFKKYSNKIAIDNELFSEFLFQGYEIQFALYFLQQYIKSIKCKNQLFKDTARLLLFDRE